MNDPHSFLPESDPASPVPDSVSQGDGQDDSDQQTVTKLTHLPAKHRDVVRRLKAQVEEAVETIAELRTENERLRQRIEELEAQPDYPEDETILALDDDPEAVRERITQFINTIDTYLDTTSSAPSDDTVDHDADT